MRILFSSCLAALIAPLAAADAEIEVGAGLWTYEVSADLGGLRMGDAGRECIKPRETKRSLERTAASLPMGCRITRSAPVDGGYAFVMACDGALVGKVDGTVTANADAAAINAAGWIDQGVRRAPVTITGTAERLGETCPAG